MEVRNVAMLLALWSETSSALVPIRTNDHAPHAHACESPDIADILAIPAARIIPG
ncbi:MAG TPA: hypothetical protein VF300_03310 [Methanothrix sp.]